MANYQLIPSRLTVFGFILLLLQLGQRIVPTREVARVDLAAPPESRQLAQPAAECADTFIAHTDGSFENEPGRLELQIVKVSNRNPRIGDHVQVIVRLLNVGQSAVLVPLSYREIGRDSLAEHSQEEQGWFSATMYHKKTYLGHLRFESRNLFGSERVQGSLVTLGPGEWTTIILGLKVELEPVPGVEARRVQAGKQVLHLKWNQGQYEWFGKGCKIETSYRSRYSSNAPEIAIKVLPK